jgi:hypothetical protein
VAVHVLQFLHRIALAVLVLRVSDSLLPWPLLLHHPPTLDRLLVVSDHALDVDPMFVDPPQSTDHALLPKHHRPLVHQFLVLKHLQPLREVADVLHPAMAPTNA